MAITTVAPLPPPPSFTASERAINEMKSAALISQGALLTNMAFLLQRCLSTTLDVHGSIVAEGEKTTNANADTITP